MTNNNYLAAAGASPFNLSSLVIGLFCLAILATPALADSLPAASSYGLDAMAPAGRWAARMTILRNGYDKRFDNAGNRVDLDAGYDGLNLATLGLAGQLNLDSDVTTEYAELMLGYGISQDLTLGAIVPYERTTTRVRLSVNGGIGTAGLQRVLTGILGYKTPKTTAVSGFGDPTLGALWRFHKSPQDSAILGFGVRLGVAKADDPDNLFDIPPGDGSTDLRFRMEYFRDLSRGFDLRLLAEHFRQLPDDVVRRPGNPLTTLSKETLRRKLGDYQEFDVELGKAFGDWRVSTTWHRYQKASDNYISKLGTDTSFLNANTLVRTDQLRFSLSWSGIEAFRNGLLAMPLIVKLETQDALRGRNFVGVHDVYLRVSTFF